MNNLHKKSNSFVDSEFLPEIPDSVLSIENQEIDTSTDRWKFRTRKNGGDLLSINWGLVNEIGRINPLTIQYMKAYLASRLKSKRTHTVSNDFKTFLMFFRWLKTTEYDLALFEWSDFDEALALRYLAYSRKETAAKGNDFSRIRKFYNWGTSNEFEDFPIENYWVLQGIRAEGNLKGHNVRFHHPTKGPFSPDELILIINAVKGQIGRIEVRIIIMLHIELGVNPLAICLLRNEHFKRFDAAGRIFYQLDVPRIKKRTSVFAVRRRPITEELGSLLEPLIEGEEKDPLIHWLDNGYPSSTISQMMNEFSESANIISPRTGKRLNIHPRRFRTTLATNMAEQGASGEHISDTLDHTDLQNVGVYIEVASTIIDRVADATDKLLTPLIDRFMGIIIPSIEEMPQPHAGNLIGGELTHLSDTTLDIGLIGGCGRDVVKKGLCELYPPLTCYLCPQFAALKDAPHSQVRSSIEKFIKANEERLDKKTISQFDEILIAINQVLGKTGGDKENE